MTSKPSYRANGHPGPPPGRIALLLGLAPRKTGSFEDWLLAVCREARARGHELAILGLEPVHPKFRAELETLGIAWHAWEPLVKRPVACMRVLARYDLLYLCMFGVLDRLSLMAYASWPSRVVYAGHSDVKNGAPGLHRRVISTVARRIVARRLDGLVGVSKYIEDRYRGWFGMPASATRTIYNGIDVERFKRHDRGNDRTRGVTLFAAANLVPGKGLRHLVRAFAKLDPSTQLIIAGDGPEEGPLRELAKELGVQSRVSLLGLRDDVDELLRRADIFVHPAIWPEAFGLTLAEAMASECAVVASRIGGISEVVEDGVSGILVPPGDEAALREALERLIKDPRYRRTLGVNGRRRVLENFSVHTSVKKHLDWCEEVLARPRSLLGRAAAAGRL
jgi:glycosyltransferase involved in cell wall biosynthesis